jgi:NADH-quinone oxidoreductase subunit L
LLIIGIVAAFFTAFYIFRLFFVVFAGEYRGKASAHESPAVMTVPMLILAALAVVAGFFNTPFAPVLGGWLQPHDEAHAAPVWITIVTVAAGLIGIWLAYAMYVKNSVARDVVANPLPWLYRLSYRKFYIDEIYDIVFVRSLAGLGTIITLFDRYVVDGLVKLSAVIVNWIGALSAKAQNGQIQRYGAVAALGLVLLVIGLTVAGGYVR